MNPERDLDVLDLQELCRIVRVEATLVEELVAYGVVEAEGEEPTAWRFERSCLRRVRTAVRLHHDLGVNPPGIGLVLDLLEELERLRR
ncbi:MAG: chaperone modulator CbpM [Planctomycetota bacterium]